MHPQCHGTPNGATVLVTTFKEFATNIGAFWGPKSWICFCEPWIHPVFVWVRVLVEKKTPPQNSSQTNETWETLKHHLPRCLQKHCLKENGRRVIFLMDLNK